MYAIIDIAILFFSTYPSNSNHEHTVSRVLWNHVCIKHICCLHVNIFYPVMYMNSSNVKREWFCKVP